MEVVKIVFKDQEKIPTIVKNIRVVAKKFLNISISEMNYPKKEDGVTGHKAEFDEKSFLN